jgi:hypothetical protein
MTTVIVDRTLHSVGSTLLGLTGERPAARDSHAVDNCQGTSKRRIAIRRTLAGRPRTRILPGSAGIAKVPSIPLLDVGGKDVVNGR